MENLKRCPFCGGEAIIEQTAHGTTSNNSVSLSFEIRCKDCGATTEPSYGNIFINLKGENGELNIWHDDRPNAINAWNRRADNADTTNQEKVV